MSTEDRVNGASTSVSPPPAPDAREERVSAVSGDRFCTECGYNLVGQSVLREPNYGMFIVRCPECATVAALQEYPLLGNWASRWGVLLAVLFFIVLLGAWFGSGAALFGLSIGTAEMACDEYGRELQTEYQAATTAPVVPVIGSGPPPSGPGIVTGPTQIITKVSTQATFAEWWSEQDPAAVLAAHGGFFGAINKSAFWLWVPASIAMFAIGTFWAVALLTVRRRYLPLWAFAILAVGISFVAIQVFEWLDDDSSRSWRVARYHLAPTMTAVALGYLMIPLTAGLLLGRSCARLLVRALLPSRLRYPLAMLWTTDGLEVPRSRRSTG